jgi:hypothetical protein
VTALVFASHARAAESSSLCVYDNRSFSEGASICIQARLAMTCSLVADRVLWKVDNEVSNLCVKPMQWISGERLQSRSARRSLRKKYEPPLSKVDKCFDFGGKHYCE